MKFKNLFAALLIALIAFQVPAFASVGIYNEDGEKIGTAVDIQVDNGLSVEMTDGKKRAVISTFESTLLSNGRVGGASTMSSSSTYLSTAGISYSVINKRIGGGGGLDSDGFGSVLPNGTNGQVLTFWITAVQSGGSWRLTPVKGWNWNRAVFDTVDEFLTMIYETSIGWIPTSHSGVVFTRNQLP